jgi:hypothetical protein
MSLTKTNQKLRRNLKKAAALLKWSGKDLMQVAERLSENGQEDEAIEFLKIAANYQAIDNKFQNPDR